MSSTAAKKFDVGEVQFALATHGLLHFLIGLNAQTASACTRLADRIDRQHAVTVRRLRDEEAFYSERCKTLREDILLLASLHAAALNALEGVVGALQKRADEHRMEIQDLKRNAATIREALTKINPLVRQIGIRDNVRSVTDFVERGASTVIRDGIDLAEQGIEAIGGLFQDGLKKVRELVGGSDPKATTPDAPPPSSKAASSEGQRGKKGTGSRGSSPSPVSSKRAKGTKR